MLEAMQDVRAFPELPDDAPVSLRRIYDRIRPDWMRAVELFNAQDLFYYRESIQSISVTRSTCKVPSNRLCRRIRHGPQDKFTWFSWLCARRIWPCSELVDSSTFSALTTVFEEDENIWEDMLPKFWPHTKGYRYQKAQEVLRLLCTLQEGGDSASQQASEELLQTALNSSDSSLRGQLIRFIHESAYKDNQWDTKALKKARLELETKFPKPSFVSSNKRPVHPVPKENLLEDLPAGRKRKNAPRNDRGTNDTLDENKYLSPGSLSRAPSRALFNYGSELDGGEMHQVSPTSTLKGVRSSVTPSTEVADIRNLAMTNSAQAPVDLETKETVTTPGSQKRKRDGASNSFSDLPNRQPLLFQSKYVKVTQRQAVDSEGSITAKKLRRDSADIERSDVATIEQDRSAVSLIGRTELAAPNTTMQQLYTQKPLNITEQGERVVLVDAQAEMQVGQLLVAIERKDAQILKLEKLVKEQLMDFNTEIGFKVEKLARDFAATIALKDAQIKEQVELIRAAIESKDAQLDQLHKEVEVVLATSRRRPSDVRGRGANEQRTASSKSSGAKGAKGANSTKTKNDAKAAYTLIDLSDGEDRK
ncbi:hypothetical protein HIM_04270 [Hirsutella minnesotensis 3608]|uniref:Uncharacterized protein n=1 Tax=Hirsutella minnesotensis 3608 TaxID=1043627 RepID=A0A0F7ZV88_9HYPO|nr:hypothetical protein HIM_04270 [Hirsutella minnesotensis 3608]